MFKFLENIQKKFTRSPNLTKIEEIALQKRGFIVKEYFTFLDLFISTLLHIGSLMLFVLCAGIVDLLLYFIFAIDATIGRGILYLFIFIPGILLLRMVFVYIFIGKLFYLNNGIVVYSKLYTNISEIPSLRYVSWIKNFVNTTNHVKTEYGEIGTPQFKRTLLILPILIFIIFTLGRLIIGEINQPSILIFIIYSCSTFGIIFSLHYLVEQIFPLYAFGNIGEKIQKLTPRIEEQSKQIQSEFRSDMNFSVLSNGFDSLSATFSEIVSLVIKLEKVEARANKGNLFDSEKYINSLRLDIVEPLSSLREFLEDQKNKLIESKKELIQVRVGGSGSTGNAELSSKRSESLIVELTENIEKLDGMIGKMI